MGRQAAQDGCSQSMKHVHPRYHPRTPPEHEPQRGSVIRTSLRHRIAHDGIAWRSGNVMGAVGHANPEGALAKARHPWAACRNRVAVPPSMRRVPDLIRPRCLSLDATLMAESSRVSRASHVPIAEPCLKRTRLMLTNSGIPRDISFCENPVGPADSENPQIA